MIRPAPSARHLRLSLSRLLATFALLSACTGGADRWAHMPAEKRDSLLATRYGLDQISLLPGFSMSVFAVVPGARSICLGTEGTVFVGNLAKDKVYAVMDEDGDGYGERVYVVDSGLNMPNGVAFREGSLYVAEVSRILRYNQIESSLADPPEPEVVFDRLPSKKHHGWRFIGFGPDGKLYVSVGAPCNVCIPADPVYATIARMNPDGSGFEIFARGIRNSVGFDWDPRTRDLWFTDNGRDLMGDDLPNCELNHAPVKGMHFGFPYCHQGDIPDPVFGAGKNCSAYTAPAALMGPHVAPLGIRFYTGSSFPPEFARRAFIALHGSWNRTKKIGYKVMMADIYDNKVTGYTDFAAGWLRANGDVLGRPVDMAVRPDGSLLISDDKQGVIYRVRYEPGG